MFCCSFVLFAVVACFCLFLNVCCYFVWLELAVIVVEYCCVFSCLCTLFVCLCVLAVVCFSLWLVVVLCCNLSLCCVL